LRSLESFKLSTLGVRHPRRIPSDRLLLDKTFAEPCIFAVVNQADVAQSVFFLFCFNALQDIFAVKNCPIWACGCRYIWTSLIIN